MPLRTRPTSGFTLIELILVMVIVTIIVGIVMPSFGSFNTGRQSKYAATRFMAVTRYARTQAASEARAYRINFEDTSFHLTVDDGGGTFTALTNDFGEKYDVPEGVTMTLDLPEKEDGKYVEVRPDGTIDPGTVTFKSRNGIETPVVCASVTDVYRIVDGGGK